MREQEMAIYVAKQTFFDSFNCFYLIADTTEDAEIDDVLDEIRICHDITEEFMYRLNECNSYTKEGLNQERIIAIYKVLCKNGGYFSNKQIEYYIKYTDQIIDEILKQVVVLGGEQNSSN